MLTRNHWKNEILAFLTAPTFFVYFAGLVLAFLTLYLPELNVLESMELETGDSAGFAAARFFAGQIGSVLLLLPCFAVSSSVLRDKEKMKRGEETLRAGLTPANAVLVRFLTQTVLMFVPIIIAGLYETIAFAGYAGNFKFLELCFTWLLPTLLFESALSAALTEWTGNCLPGIIVSILVWIFTQGSTADIGDYNSCIAIRHQMIGGFLAYASSTKAVAANRIIVTLLAAALVVAAVYGYSFRQKRRLKH